MYRYWQILVILYLFVTSPVIGQLNIDSLEQVVNTKIINRKADNNVVQDLKYLISQYRYTDWDKAFQYADIMQNIKTDDNRVNVWAKGLGLKFKGNLYYDKGQYQSALGKYYEALEFYLSVDDSLNVADMYSYIAYLYFSLTDYITAEQLYTNALEINKSFKNKYYIDGYSNNLMMLASIAVKQNQFNSALDYSNKAKKSFSSLEDTLATVRADIWIVKSLIGLDSLASAMDSAKNAISILDVITTPKFIDMKNEYKVYLLNEIAKIYEIKTDYANSLKNYDAAHSLSKKISNSSLEASVEVALARVEYILNRNSKAINLLQSVIKNDEYKNLYQEKIDAATLLAKVYLKNQNYKKAYNYKIYSDTIKDSLLSARVYDNLNNLRAVYEYNRRKKENELLKLNVASEKRQKLYVISFLVILTILSLMLIRRYFNTKKLNQKLQAYNDEKKTLIKILAHDLKNPFSNFISSIDLINYQYETLDEEFKKNILSNLNTSAHKYHSLLENILSWIKTDSNNYKLEKQEIKLLGLIEEIIEVYKPAIDDKNITLKVDVAIDYLCFSDRNMLSAIIRNIINNSVKFTCRDGEIKISAKDHEGKCNITISDNGIGMDKTELQNLFNGEINSSDAEEKGYGFGMQIINEMMNKINANINVDSDKGKGTRISILLN